MIYTIGLLIAAVLALISYSTFDVRYGLGALLIAGVCWLYDFMADNGPPE